MNSKHINTLRINYEESFIICKLIINKYCVCHGVLGGTGGGSVFSLNSTPLFSNLVSENMLLTTALFLLAFTMGTARSQDWVGTYTTNSECYPECCCISGTVVLSRPAKNVLKVASGLSGTCGGQTQFTTAIDYPTGYTVDLALGPQTLRCTLSADSQQITAVNTAAPQCSGKAYKNGVVKRDANVIIPFMLMVAAFFLNY
jgi:hypothetical protein